MIEEYKKRVFTIEELEDIRKVAEEKIECVKGGNCELELDMYPHDYGVLVENNPERQWVYFHCAKCGYDWALWKVLKRIQKKCVICGEPTWHRHKLDNEFVYCHDECYEKAKEKNR